MREGVVAVSGTCVFVTHTQRHRFKDTNVPFSTHEHKVSNFNPTEQAQSMRHVMEQGTKTVCFYTAAEAAAGRGQNTKHGVYDSWQSERWIKRDLSTRFQHQNIKL